MAEFEFINWLRSRTPSDPRVVIGPGDDCAVLAAADRPWLVTADMLMEGSHFVLAEAGGRRVGRKAMAVNLSDIAAMAGEPVAAVATIALPRAQGEALADEVYLGMREVGDVFGVALAGGDTNSWDGGLVLSVTLFGHPTPPGPVLRRGARAGDWLFVTGPLGGSILGKHLEFTPRIREGQFLQSHIALHAMIDVSDGLAADVGHLCHESGCGAVLFADAIPIADAARQLARQRNDGVSALQHALADGEDFELAFAVAPEDGKRLLNQQPIPGCSLHHVGEFIAGAGLFLEGAGMRTSLAPRGYVHQF